MNTTEAIARTAQLLLERTDELAPIFDEAIHAAAPALSADPTMAADLTASNKAYMLHWVGTTARHPGEPVPTDPPPEALDVARNVVRRGIAPEVLTHAYRAGQNLGWRLWMQAAAEVVADKRQLIAVLEESSASLFGYVDEVLDTALAEVQRTRDELVGGALSRRIETVRLILDGAPIDEQAAAARLGYDLVRNHTAIVLWAAAGDDVQGTLEETALALGRAAGVRRPLTLAAGASGLWAWLGTDGAPDVAAMRHAMDEAPAGVRATVGTTLPAITGFRRSHEAAVAAQRVVAAQREARRLTTFADIEVAALASHDREAAAAFVARTLGPLADPSDTMARLRETVRVFLEEGGHAPRTAERLMTHRNTILHRVARAGELLGRPVGEQRLALALALELVRWGGFAD